MDDIIIQLILNRLGIILNQFSDNEVRVWAVMWLVTHTVAVVITKLVVKKDDYGCSRWLDNEWLWPTLIDVGWFIIPTILGVFVAAIRHDYGYTPDQRILLWEGIKFATITIGSIEVLCLGGLVLVIFAKGLAVMFNDIDDKHQRARR